MKISCNRVTGVFVGVLFTAFTEVFGGGFCQGFLGSFCQPRVWEFLGFLAVGSFWGFWYIHGYLIRYISYDNKRFIKDKRKGTMLYMVLYYTF